MGLCAGARLGSHRDSDRGGGPDIRRGREWLHALPGRENREGDLGEEYWPGVPGCGDVMPAFAVDRWRVADRFHGSEAQGECYGFGQTDGKGGLESAG